MAHRRPLLALALLAGLLCGCTSIGELTESLGTVFTTGAPPSDRLPPAPAPVYAPGDSFVYNDNGLTTQEQVVSVAPDRVVWTNDSGLIWTKDTALVTPQLRWSSHPELGRGQQSITGSPDQLFPLREGNIVAYSVRGSSENLPEGWQEEHRCVVSGQEDVEVPAGLFTTFRIDCQRKDFLDTYYYSPTVQNFVLRLRDFGGTISRKELLSVTLANDRTRDLPAAVAQSPNPVSGPTSAQPIAPVAAMPMASDTMADPAMADEKSDQMMEAGDMSRANTLITRLEDVVTRLEKVANMVPEDGKPMAADASAGGGSAGSGSSAGGPWAVHLTSYRSQRGAQRGWDVLKKKFPELGSKRLVTSEFDPGNGRGTFVRLMAAGFPTRAAANDFCRPIKAKEQFCQARGPLP